LEAICVASVWLEAVIPRKDSGQPTAQGEETQVSRSDFSREVVESYVMHAPEEPSGHSDSAQSLIQRIDESDKRANRSYRKIRRHLREVAAHFNYELLNASYKALPALLARDYGIQVQGRLTRDYVVAPDGSAYEVNILGTGVQNGRTVTIVGESKVQLSVQEVDRFLRRKLKPLQSLVENPFPVLVAHMVSSPKVLPHARAKGVAVYLSYEFD
jgi:hypothetical protein